MKGAPRFRQFQRHRSHSRSSRPPVPATESGRIRRSVAIGFHPLFSPFRRRYLSLGGQAGIASLPGAGLGNPLLALGPAIRHARVYQSQCPVHQSAAPGVPDCESDPRRWSDVLNRIAGRSLRLLSDWARVGTRPLAVCLPRCRWAVRIQTHPRGLRRMARPLGGHQHRSPSLRRRVLASSKARPGTGARLGGQRYVVSPRRTTAGSLLCRWVRGGLPFRCGGGPVASGPARPCPSALAVGARRFRVGHRVGVVSAVAHVGRGSTRLPLASIE